MKGILLSKLLGQSKREESPKLKPIQIDAIMLEEGVWLESKIELRNHYEYVLIQREYFSIADSHDLFVAIDGGGEAYLYRGRWNDGAIE